MNWCAWSKIFFFKENGRRPVNVLLARRDINHNLTSPNLSGADVDPDPDAADACADPNSRCVNGTCTCSASFTGEPRDLSCRLGRGAACGGGREALCVSGTACDPSTQTCTLRAGERCAHAGEGECVQGSECDINGQCRLQLHQPCRGADAVLCLTRWWATSWWRGK